MTDATSPLLNETLRSLKEVLAARAPKRSLPSEYWINVFRDNKRGWISGEQSFTSIEDVYEGICDGVRDSTYMHTLHSQCVDGVWSTEILELEDVARQWANEQPETDSFLFANSAGRRM